MFILCLEILFILIKYKGILKEYIYNIKGIEIFEYCYLCTAYEDDTTFFLKDENSTVHLSEKFKLFSDFSGLKPNATKCEIAGIGVLKRVQATVCAMKCTDLRNEAIKILGIYFSNNQKIKNEKKNFNIISNIQGVPYLGRIGNLTLEGRIVVFKTLAISLAIVTKIQNGQMIRENAKIFSLEKLFSENKT